MIHEANIFKPTHDPCQQCHRRRMISKSPSSTSVQLNNPKRRQRRMRTQQRSAAVCTAALYLLSSSSSTNAQTTECPRGHNGWATNFKGGGCTTYYWCSDGHRSSILYECMNWMKFDVKSSMCKSAELVECAGGGGDDGARETTVLNAAEEAEAADGNDTTVATPAYGIAIAPTVAPTSTKAGPPIYYGDLRSTSCKSLLVEPDTQPDWMSDEEHNRFRSKEECCMVMFDWLPLVHCLGEGYVETNYVVVTRTPTPPPTVGPTISPTVEPTTAPTLRPSDTPTVAPSTSPMITELIRTPTVAFHYEKEAVDQQIQHDNNEDNILSQFLSSANANIDAGGDHHDTAITTGVLPPSSSRELHLPAIADASISQQRSDANFKNQPVLAVDGGANGERFDSLLKFDIGSIVTKGSVNGAVLRIHVASGCFSGGTFTTTTSTSWNPNSVSWDTAPDPDGNIIGTLDRLTDGNWYELHLLPVLSSIVMNGRNMEEEGDDDSYYLSIRISSFINDRCMYSSMDESDGSKAPYIAVRYNDNSNNDSRLPRPKGANPTPSLNSNNIAATPVATSPPLSAGQFLLLRATDDATIDASNPTINLSKEPTLKTASHSIREILDFIIRFDLSEVLQDDGGGGGDHSTSTLIITPMKSAELYLFAERSCPSSSSGTFVLMNDDDDWTEEDISWSKASAYSNDLNVHWSGSNEYDGRSKSGPIGPVESHHWHSVDVSQALDQALQARQRAVTFRIISTNEGECEYSSIQGGRDPKLMVTF